MIVAHQASSKTPYINKIELFFSNFRTKIYVSTKHTVLGCAWCVYIHQQVWDTSTSKYKVVSSTYCDRSTCGTQPTSTNVKFEKNAVFRHFVACLLCNNHDMLTKSQELSHTTFFIIIMYLHTFGTLQNTILCIFQSTLYFQPIYHFFTSFILFAYRIQRVRCHNGG